MTGPRVKSWLRRSITLQAIITMVFALLILPALAVVIGFSFHENVRNLTTLSNRFIDQASQDAGEMSGNLLQPVVEALRLMAGAEETTPTPSIQPSRTASIEWSRGSTMIAAAATPESRPMPSGT